MNSAERLLKIYDAVVAQGSDVQLIKVWARVFELDGTTRDFEDEVTACIMALRQQIDFVRTRLNEHSVPAELLSPGFERLKDIASPARLHAPWSSVAGNIRPPECRLTFKWATWVLRDEDEDEPSNEQMAALLVNLNALEEALQTAELSNYLREFIQHQLNVIRAALRIYGAQGARPLKDALQKVAGAFTVEGTRVEEEFQKSPDKTKGIIVKAGEVIKQAAEICDSVDKIWKFGEGVWSTVTQAAPQLLSYVDMNAK